MHLTVLARAYHQMAMVHAKHSMATAVHLMAIARACCLLVKAHATHLMVMY